MSKPLSGVRADEKHSYSSLERIAVTVRSNLGLAPEAALDPLKIFEDLNDLKIVRGNGTGIPLWGHVAVLEDSEGYAHYDRDRKMLEIVASEQTYQWFQSGHPRSAYLLAHELGHCLLHTEQLVRLAKLPTNQQAAFHRGNEGHKTFEDTEWQANGFAGALLMPARGLAQLEREHRLLTPSLIVKQFGVSKEAASYRLGLYRQRRQELID